MVGTNSIGIVLIRFEAHPKQNERKRGFTQMLDNKIEEKWPLTEVAKYNSQGSFLIYTLMVTIKMIIDLAMIFRFWTTSSWPGRYFYFPALPDNFDDGSTVRPAAPQLPKISSLISWPNKTTIPHKPLYSQVCFMHFALLLRFALNFVVHFVQDVYCVIRTYVLYYSHKRWFQCTKKNLMDIVEREVSHRC